MYVFGIMRDIYLRKERRRMKWGRKNFNGVKLNYEMFWKILYLKDFM